jgi:hypothetical protein
MIEKITAIIIPIGNFKKYEELRKQTSLETDKTLREKAMTMFLTHRSAEREFIQSVLRKS